MNKRAEDPAKSAAEARREAATAALHQDSSNLLISMNVPIVMFGSDMRLRCFTPMAEKALNLIPGDIGRPISDLNPKIGLINLEELIAEVIGNGITKELDLQAPAGNCYSLRISPYRTHGNEVGGAVMVFIDIADRKLAEDKLRSLVSELESFPHTISHDLRAPLRALQGLAEALGEDYRERFDDTGRDYLTRIIGAARKMDRLILDLLAYSRLGQSEQNMRPVSLDDAAREALSRFDDDIRDRGAEISLTRPLGQVMGNHSMLVTILANLIGNAIKFMAPGVTPKVLIRALKTDGRIRLCVEDNGIGIDPDHHQRIFRIFKRLHGAERYPGTGTGLAIVRKGMESMGGMAGVESQTGNGSCFWLELPAPEKTAWIP